jgi:hypothetical protein
LTGASYANQTGETAQFCVPRRPPRRSIAQFYEHPKRKSGNARKYHAVRRLGKNFAIDANFVVQCFTGVKNGCRKSIPFNNQTALFQATLKSFNVRKAVSVLQLF